MPGPNTSMKSSVVVDTNVILRWLLNDDPHLSPRAAGFWRTVTDGEQQAFIAESVFAETVFALQYHFRVERGAISDHLLGLIGIRGIEVANAPVLAAALAIYETAPALSFIDAVALSHARHRSQALLSYDLALNKAAKRLQPT